jgi:hypothetical protein
MAYGDLAGDYKNIISTQNLVPRSGTLLGFYVNSTSSGTLLIYDSATTTTNLQISGLITPAIGWNNYPVKFVNGLYVVIANTLNLTVVWQ